MKKPIKESRSIFEKHNIHLNLDKINQKILDPNFWKNKTEAEKIIKEKKKYEDLINSYNSSVQECNDHIDLYNLAIKEHGLEGTNGFLGTFIPNGLRETTRKPIPVEVIKDIQQICKEMDDDLRWLIALLSDTGMRLGEAVGLLKSDIILDTDTPHLNLIPHPWRRLKTTGSKRKVPLVGASLWSARRIKQSNPTNQFAFPRYSNEQSHNSNSASAALNKWLRSHAPE